MDEDVAVQREVGARDRIISAARCLFSSRGFHQTAMADLAKEAKVSVGAIYRSFDNKADIVRAIIHNDMERVLAELQALCERLEAGHLTVEQAFEHLILSQFAQKEEALSHEILAEAHRNVDVAGAIGAFCGQCRATIGRMARVGNPGLSGEDMEGAEELILACMFGFAHRNLAQPQLDNQTTARIASRLILNALRVG